MARNTVTATNEVEGLEGFPISHIFMVGYNLWIDHHDDLAIATFKRGAENESCVCCILYYINLQHRQGNINRNLLLPLALEGAIRGNTGCMNILILCYEIASEALENHWVKMMNKFGSTANSEEKRKEMKKDSANRCIVCRAKDSKERTFDKCGICKYYTYCGKKCQTRHWKQGYHNGECRQLMILKEHCKPQHMREIREAIIRGDDPRNIVRLQTLRTHLGLNQPKERYEELMLSLKNDGNSNELVRIANSDGTVRIGSSPEAM